jgi:hypothetical protein
MGECVTYSCQLEDFGCEVLENGGHVDGGLGADAHLVLGVVLEETLDTTAGELERCQHGDPPGAQNKIDEVAQMRCCSDSWVRRVSCAVLPSCAM